MRTAILNDEAEHAHGEVVRDGCAVVVNVKEHPLQPEHIGQRSDRVGDVLEAVFVTIQ
jgi:hypothetical protein